MDISLFQWGQFITLLLISLALGMDAFSLGIGVGMGKLRLREVLSISTTIGLFHVAMPLLGIWIGHTLSSVVGDIAILIGGGVLIALGIHMLWSGFTQEEKQSQLYTKGFGLILFAVSVSLDALSVGFSFGLIEVNQLLAVTLFGVTGGLMAGCGLMIGRSFGGWLGDYSEIIGGVILILFGCKFLW
ncbi:manganese efflux pump [Brevibacillus fluminis]|uniref:Putative manganese efflux pump MntP n=1 Tax=Brevibacillus fluminis TaxID=511487 RepID=A0A3M8D1S7_9BACL|nr:manganese efflux pump MntP family protein [Brevibacillus fluminis]RNB82030.1 manganese efflux pump [Brevibacillus fluminis]